MRADPTRTRDPAGPEELAKQLLDGKWIGGVDVEIDRITIQFAESYSSLPPFDAELQIYNLSGASFGSSEEWNDELGRLEGFGSRQAAQRGLLVNKSLRQTEAVQGVNVTSGGALCIHFPTVTLTVTAITNVRWSDSWRLSCGLDHSVIIAGETEGSMRVYPPCSHR